MFNLQNHLIYGMILRLLGLSAFFSGSEVSIIGIGNEVKVDGEWFLVIDCGVVGDTIKILRADSGERFEIHEEDIEETN